MYSCSFLLICKYSCSFLLFQALRLLNLLDMYVYHSCIFFVSSYSRRFGYSFWLSHIYSVSIRVRSFILGASVTQPVGAICKSFMYVLCFLPLWIYIYVYHLFMWYLFPILGASITQLVGARPRDARLLGLQPPPAMETGARFRLPF